MGERQSGVSVEDSGISSPLTRPDSGRKARIKAFDEFDFDHLPEGVVLMGEPFPLPVVDVLFDSLTARPNPLQRRK